MSTIDPQKVLETLKKDPSYSAQPEPVQKAMEPFMVALPSVLNDMVEEPVSLKTLMQAKLTFTKYLVSNGYIKAVISAMPEESFGFFDAEDMAEMLTGTLESFLELATDILGDVQEFLDTQGVDEETLMSHPKGIGLSPEALALYKAGRLTIGDLLVLQPQVLVKTD